MLFCKNVIQTFRRQSRISALTRKVRAWRMTSDFTQHAIAPWSWSLAAVKIWFADNIFDWSKSIIPMPQKLTLKKNFKLKTFTKLNRQNLLRPITHYATFIGLSHSFIAFLCFKNDATMQTIQKWCENAKTFGVCNGSNMYYNM